MQKTESYKIIQNDFHKVCSEFREKIAITYYKKNGETEECSYAQMEKRVTDLVDLYKKRGIQRGDRVAVLIPLCTNAYLDILALAYMGATSVILDINLHEEELIRILLDADVSSVVTVQSIYEEKLQKIAVPVFEASDACKILKDVQMTHPSDPDLEAIAILYSSGTTSKAKGVVIGYEQEINAMDYLLKVVGTTDIRYLMLFPNSHVSGFTDFMVLLLRGGTLATMEDASATQLMKGFQLYKPNTFGMVPKVWETFKCKIEDAIREKGKRKAKTIFRLIRFCGTLRKLTGINLGRKLFHSINEQVFGGNLISVHSGGGKSNPEVSRFFWNLGYDCFDFYASTEANIPILVTDGKKYMDSVGRVDANPNTDIRIWKPDENGIGEIQVKSNTMMRGYFRNPELTKEAFEGEYFKTGDYGKVIKKQVYITGRIKESIHLRNGEKVSPDDVEETYKPYLPVDLEFAVVGVPDGEAYDKIAVFIVAKKGAYDREFYNINQNITMNYQHKRLVYVDELPKTSVGKVKRIALRKNYTKGVRVQEKGYVGKCKEEPKEEEIIVSSNPKEVFLQILKKYSEKENIAPQDKIIGDLGMDSLGLFEMCVDIEMMCGINLQNQLNPSVTVEELLEYIQRENGTENTTNIVEQYPKKRRKGDWRRLERFSRWVRRNYDFSVEGLKNLDMEENYIFAPNHESHMDGLLMLSTLPRRMQDRVCSMAADYLFKNPFLRVGTVIMGGIPVDRTGNPAMATKRIYDLMNKGDASLLIHPEGTRTRDGKMGKFKVGAAELSKRTGIKIVPVAIDGAREIYPPDRRLPKMKKREDGKKYPISICFGKPLDPEANADEEKMTQALFEEVVKLKSKKEKTIIEILEDYTDCGKILESHHLKNDLGIDSLLLMELFVRLEREFHVNIPMHLVQINTVADLMKYIEDNSGKNSSKEAEKKELIDYNDYPEKFSQKIEGNLLDVVEELRQTYNFVVSGLENIPKDTNFLISSNHVSYLDPYWILAGLGDTYIHEHKFATFAAIHTMEDKKMFDMIGGIPVDREGNVLPAIECGRRCLSEGYDLIIFPEGARSRDGSMLPFKKGAAELAIQCQVPILPIRIDGGFEIFPRHIEKPRLHKENGEKFTLEITIGTPIWQKGMNSEEYTKTLKKTISQMKKAKTGDKI